MSTAALAGPVRRANAAPARSRLYVAVLAVLLLFVSSCQREQPVPPEPAPRMVRTQVLVQQRLSHELELPAEVRPRIEIAYGFRVGGKIAQRKVSVGDQVKAGQSLARLDPQDVRPAIDAARAALEAGRTELALAESDLERTVELQAQGYVSKGQFDRQQAAVDAARARLAQAQAGLTTARTNARFQDLRADAAGVVTAVQAEAGQVVAAGQAVVRVAPLGEFELLVNVPEAELGAIRAIEHWQARLPALAERRFEARLRELSPLADPASRSYAMRLSILGDTEGVALGMSAVVSALRAGEQGIIVPLAALLAQDGEPGVWLVRADHTVTRVPVAIGEARGEGVRVHSGLEAGQRIVVAGASLLHEGQKIRFDESAR